MGRSAYFNTGVVYKFGDQDSEDILKFSGLDITEDEDDDGLRHMWVRKWNLESARALLQTCSGMQKEPKWDSYEQTQEGSESLLKDLRETLVTGETDASVHRYILGCIIYHQLLYTPVLVAEYEG